MVYTMLYLLFEVAIRLGIEHHSQVLPANSVAKIRLLFELTKENAEKVSAINFPAKDSASDSSQIKFGELFCDMEFYVYLCRNK